jgi:hypothetical protein
MTAVFNALFALISSLHKTFLRRLYPFSGPLKNQTPGPGFVVLSIVCMCCAISKMWVSMMAAEVEEVVCLTHAPDSGLRGFANQQLYASSRL